MTCNNVICTSTETDLKMTTMASKETITIFTENLESWIAYL